MIIETKVKQDTGPLRNVWESAIARKRTRSEAGASRLVIPSSDTERTQPPTPASACEGEGKLPSPRPSPPPRISSYARARSLSWS